MDAGINPPVDFDDRHLTEVDTPLRLDAHAGAQDRPKRPYHPVWWNEWLAAGD